MADLIDTANKITELVDSHGEIVDCKVKKCGTCRLIKELRDEIGKDTKITGPGWSNNRYIYVVYKNGKEVAKVDSTYKVAKIIKSSQSTARKLVDEGTVRKGYNVERFIRELEEKQ